jgi:hypothetical protein
MMQNERTTLTYTGKLFDFWEPTPDMVCIEDIAHALALTNRYNGHTYQPYSVAEHCERMSYLPGNPLVNLLHEGAEAYVGDIISPHKKHLEWCVPDAGNVCGVSFRDQESIILDVVGEALGVSNLAYDVHLPETKRADLIMLATETRDLMPESSIYTWWTKEVEPLEEKIYPLHWALVEDQFLGSRISSWPDTRNLRKENTNETTGRCSELQKPQ